jgi:hypothetical protein
MKEWQRRFAWFPKEINGTKVWLENYWERFVEWPRPRTREEQQIFMLRIGVLPWIYLPWGQWEYRLEPPAEADTKVVAFKR